LVEPGPEDVAALRLGPDTERVVLLERLRLANGLPMAIERAILTPDLADVLRADLERGSLHAAMERLGRIPTRSDARVSARPSTAEERTLLGQGSSGVVLCERHVILDQQDVPLEHTETRYAAERYVFAAVVERGSPRSTVAERGSPSG
jgi:GntR family transcriptional regulator